MSPYFHFIFCFQKFVENTMETFYCFLFLLFPLKAFENRKKSENKVTFS